MMAVRPKHGTFYDGTAALNTFPKSAGGDRSTAASGATRRLLFRFMGAVWDILFVRRRLAALSAVLIVALVFLSYFPSLRGDFLWDDDWNILDSRPLRSLAGLWQIWFKIGATQQYYPLTHSSFWLDYHLWGLNPLPYRVINVLLHAFNAILVWLILRRLRIRKGVSPAY